MQKTNVSIDVRMEAYEMFGCVRSQMKYEQQNVFLLVRLPLYLY